VDIVVLHMVWFVLPVVWLVLPEVGCPGLAQQLHEVGVHVQQEILQTPILFRNQHIISNANDATE
jgi:hypothetical protein